MSFLELLVGVDMNPLVQVMPFKRFVDSVRCGGAGLLFVVFAAAIRGEVVVATRFQKLFQTARKISDRPALICV